MRRKQESLRDQPRLHGDLVFDVGMHKGEDTALYLRKGFRVVAFEADPELVATCCQRFESELSDGRLTVVEGAITGDRAATVRLYRHSQKTEWGTVDEAWATRNSRHGAIRSIEVPTVNFADCLRRFGIPYYMKVDIEGKDIVCLDALREFENRPVYVSLESEKVDWAALVREFDLLESLGYDRFAAVQQQDLPGRDIVARGLSGSPFGYRLEPDCSGSFGEDLWVPWADRAGVLEEYRHIFRRYRMMGDQSLINRTLLTRAMRSCLSRLLRKPLPGWYDTHAMRSDAIPGDVLQDRAQVEKTPAH